MHTNDTVAELVSLLRAHGISVPGESEAASDTASSTPAVPAAGTAIAEAPAAEIGFVRCTNCHAQLALYAADTAANVAPAVPANVAPAMPANVAPAAANVAPAVPANVAPAAANVAPAAADVAPAAANVAPAAADVAPAAANVPPAPAPANIAPMSSRRSLSPRWYSVTAARQVGVMYAVWDPVVKDLVNGVHDWRAVKFSTEGEARHHYNEEQAAGRIRIHTQ